MKLSDIKFISESSKSSTIKVTFGAKFTYSEREIYPAYVNFIAKKLNIKVKKIKLLKKSPQKMVSGEVQAAALKFDSLKKEQMS